MIFISIWYIEKVFPQNLWIIHCRRVVVFSCLSILIYILLHHTKEPKLFIYNTFEINNIYLHMYVYRKWKIKQFRNKHQRQQQQARAAPTPFSCLYIRFMLYAFRIIWILLGEESDFGKLYIQCLSECGRVSRQLFKAQEQNKSNNKSGKKTQAVFYSTQV